MIDFCVLTVQPSTPHILKNGKADHHKQSLCYETS